MHRRETFWIVRRDGREVPVRIALAALGASGLVMRLRDVSGELRFETSNYQDLPGRAPEMAQRLREAQAARTRSAELVNLVAHELRNACGAVKLWTSVLLKQRALDGIPDGAEALAASTARMERLVADLRETAGSDARALTVEPVGGVVARALVAKVAQTAQADVRSGRIVVTVAPGLPELCADEARILQVLANLIDNALKFSPESSTITVAARAGSRPDEVIFLVRDAGIGIARANQGRIFDRGFQVNPGDRRGSGLGLAICREIVEAHGGELTVESEPGAGTTFSFGLSAETGTMVSAQAGARTQDRSLP